MTGLEGSSDISSVSGETGITPPNTPTSPSTSSGEAGRTVSAPPQKGAANTASRVTASGKRPGSAPASLASSPSHQIKGTHLPSEARTGSVEGTDNLGSIVKPQSEGNDIHAAIFHSVRNQLKGKIAKLEEKFAIGADIYRQIREDIKDLNKNLTAMPEDIRLRAAVRREVSKLRKLDRQLDRINGEIADAVMSLHNLTHPS